MTGKVKNYHFLPYYMMLSALMFALAGCGGDGGIMGNLPPEADYWLVHPAGTPLFMSCN